MSEYKTKNISLIGIGGIGISSIARYFLATRAVISGSDIQDSKLLKELKSEGIKVRIGHKKANITKKIDLVVYNKAIPQDNPELKESKRLGIKILSYPEAINEISNVVPGTWKPVGLNGLEIKWRYKFQVAHNSLN